MYQSILVVRFYINIEFINLIQNSSDMLWNNHLSEEQKKAVIKRMVEDDEFDSIDDDSELDTTEEK